MSPSGFKIAVASSGLGHIARGVEAWAADTSEALHLRGVKVVLYKGAGIASKPYERVVPCWKPDDLDSRTLLSIMPRWLGWRIGLGSSHEVQQATFALKLILHLRRQRADILHVQDPRVAIITQRARSLGLIRTRTILGHGTEEPLDFLKGIHYLQHLAPWHLDRARENGAWRPTWTAIPNFIDTNRFRPGRSHELRAELGIPENAVVVLTAAAIKRSHKRVDHLTAEFAHFLAQRPESSAWLVVAGAREGDTDEVMAEGKKLLGERVRFLPSFPRERMPDLYRAADVFVLASLFEMMPIAVLEATSSGLPCIVNRHPILEWMTGPGGRHIDMAVRGDLARVLESLHDKRRLLEEIGDQARRHCLQCFSQEIVVDQILEYYQRVEGSDIS